jgi:hypothetical protein
MTNHTKARDDRGTIWTRQGLDEWAHQDKWTAHPITKITQKYIFIREGVHRTQTLLDRKALERYGRLRSEQETYYTNAAKHAEERQSQKIWAETEAFRRANIQEHQERIMVLEPNLLLLGLKSPWTRADVLTAFRREAQKHHPDRGGDPAMFRRLIEAKDRALAGAKA